MKPETFEIESNEMSKEINFFTVKYLFEFYSDAFLSSYTCVDKVKNKSSELCFVFNLYYNHRNNRIYSTLKITNFHFRMLSDSIESPKHLIFFHQRAESKQLISPFLIYRRSLTFNHFQQDRKF